MARKRYNEEDILRLLREIDVHLHGGMDVMSACRTAVFLTRPIMDGVSGMSSPQIMYHFSIGFLKLAVSCLGLGEGKVVYSDRAG